MFEVTVSGRFTASHQLHRPDGNREPLHTHDWQVRVTYAGRRLSSNGWLIDFGLVRRHLNALLSKLEAQNLNQVGALHGREPSAEAVALYFAENLPAALNADVLLTCVEVEEEPGCAARYFPGRP